jgi:hypothetical protein
MMDKGFAIGRVSGKGAMDTASIFFFKKRRGKVRNFLFKRKR